MSTGLRLGEYAVTPLYNIKAVVQTTGISPSTFARMGATLQHRRTQRSESGYRLYSERDITVIRWLKAQVDAGMSISQAVSWLGNLIATAGEARQAVLPMAGSGAPLHDTLITLPPPHRQAVRDLNTLQQELIIALSHYDEESAEQAIAEAFSIYPVEQVGDQLFMPVLLELGERRQRGDLSLTSEHFAGNYLLQRLSALLRATPNPSGGPLIWAGCIHGETHDAGALLLTIYLRRSGYHVHYLGENLPVEEAAVKEIIQEARRHQPAMILLSASTPPAAEKLGQLSSHLTQSGHLPAIVGYSGSIYNRHPEFRAATAGVYIGAYAKEVVQNLDELLAERHRANKKDDKKKSMDRSAVQNSRR